MRTDFKHIAIRFLLPVLLALLCASATGCVSNSDSIISKVNLVAPPQKIVYVKGIDNKLDFNGGTAASCLEFNPTAGYFVESILAYKQKNLVTNVNFHKPGVYTVTVGKKTLWFMTEVFFQYTVQVVAEETGINMEEPEDESYWFEEIDPFDFENAAYVITTPPSNIIYPVGYEGEIDVSGMVVKEPKLFFPEEYALSDLDYTLSTDADFSVPGSYIVTVTVEDEGTEKVFWFTVAVCEGGE